MTTVRLSWMLARRSGGDLRTTALPVIAFGCVTALLLVVLGGARSFLRWDDDLGEVYQVLAAFALVLLVVPLVSLGGSAARLSARRRDDRLSTLRLLGATPAAVAAMSVLEATALAVAGALTGAVGYAALAPLVGLVHFRGEPVGSAIWLPWWAPVAVVGVVALVAALSAVAGMRRVLITPLGVRRRQDPPRISVFRLVIAALGIVGAVVAVNSQYRDIAVVIGVAAGAFAVALLVVNLIGPWAVGVLGRGQLRRARTPERLLAARSMLDDPKAVWRQVSGVVMTVVVAVIGGSGAALMGAFGELEGDDALLAQDVYTGVVLTIAISFVMVACSVSINQTAALLDRRDLYVSLHKLGMDRSTMDAARSRAIMFPLVAGALWAAVSAGVLTAPLTGAAVLFSPLAVLTVIGCVVAGLCLLWLSLLGTRPVLRSVAKV